MLTDLWNETMKESLTIKAVRHVIDSVRPLFIESRFIEKGTHFFRARTTKGDEPFSFFKDLTYRSDLEEIEMGRANSPRHSVFYGSMSSAELKQALLTVCMETSKLMRDGNLGHQTFTIGIWKVKKPFAIPTMLPREPLSISARSKDIYAAIEQYRQGLDMDNRNRFDLFHRLIEREFMKRVRSDSPSDVYTISAAFAEFIYEKLGVGLAYPSVETEGMGQNVALLPHIVEGCLKPAGAQFVQFHRSGENQTTLCQYKMAFGNHHPIRWIDMHPKYAVFRDFIPYKEK